MKALFVTTMTNDTDSLVTAWDCWNDTPADRVRFNHMGGGQDAEILGAARASSPDIIFYVGGCAGTGMPTEDTFRALRRIAPSVNLCCDAADDPWHPVLNSHKAGECFDLQVALDGRAGAPVDLVTITPVDPTPYDRPCFERDVACGFSGNFGLRGKRWTIVGPLSDAGLVTVRKRVTVGAYDDHAAFLRRCRVVLNTSFSGSGRTHHVKGRVLEAGFAGAALLEPMESPVRDWFPEDSFYSYKDTEDAARIIRTLDNREIAKKTMVFCAMVRSTYHPSRIYGAMLTAVEERRSVVAA
jgi:hypothetical protein